MKLRSRLYLFALLPFLCMLIHRNVTAEVVRRDNGFLFSIEKDGQTSYLLGTIHAGFSVEQTLGDNIVNVVKKVQKLYVEADITDSKTVDRSVDLYGFTKAPSLLRVIGDERFNFYHKVLVDRAKFFDKDEFARAKPWLISMVIPICDPLQDDPLYIEFGSELQLILLAKNLGIPVGEIEGSDAQVKVLDTGTSSRAGLIFEAYTNLVRSHIIFGFVRDEVLAWSASDLSTFEKIVEKRRIMNDPYSRFYNESILESRNRSMASKISSILSKESGMLFAIGTEHLVGPESVIQELSKNGFRVRRL